RSLGRRGGGAAALGGVLRGAPGGRLRLHGPARRLRGEVHPLGLLPGDAPADGRAARRLLRGQPDLPDHRLHEQLRDDRKPALFKGIYAILQRALHRAGEAQHGAAQAGRMTERRRIMRNLFLTAALAAATAGGASAAVLTAPPAVRPGATRPPEAVKAQVPGWSAANPFAAESPLPYHLPPFDRIKDGDWAPAFEEGMLEQRAEVDAIADS